MAKTYGTGLIGLDVKPRRKFRVRSNKFTHRKLNRWFLPMLIAVGLVGVLIISGVR